MWVSADRDPARQTVADRLLDSLAELVWRHRALAVRDGRYTELHAELIATEVAHELEVARGLLLQRPRSAE